MIIDELKEMLLKMKFKEHLTEKGDKTTTEESNSGFTGYRLINLVVFTSLLNNSPGFVVRLSKW